MEQEIKIGDIYEVHCYKHNGKIDRVCDEAMILDVTDDYIVCGNYRTNLTESNGKSHRTKEAAILFFYKKRWFNILAQLKKYGLFYYCNIRVFTDGSFKILDKNEYKYHKKIMHYPKEIDDILKYELSNLIEMERKKEYPFSKEIIDEYYEKYLKLRKEKEENQKK